MTNNEVTAEYMSDLLNLLNNAEGDVSDAISYIEKREETKKWWFDHLKEKGHKVEEIGSESTEDIARFEEATDKLSEVSSLLEEVIESLEAIIAN